MDNKASASFSVRAAAVKLSEAFGLTTPGARKPGSRGAACIFCGAEAAEKPQDVCIPCHADLPRIRTACMVCGVPLQAAELSCAGCLRSRPIYDRSLIPFAYEPPVDRLIKLLKFGGDLIAARELAELFLAEAQFNELPQCLVPVPLHSRRLLERGYNQALELGRHLARALGLHLNATLCVRTRHTLPQSSLDARLRRRNIRGAFAVMKPLRASHFAILDDVVTTGSTAAELARVLKHAGARRVDVWAIARAHG